MQTRLQLYMEPKRPFYPGDYHTKPSAHPEKLTAAERGVRVLREREGSSFYNKPEAISIYSTDSVPLFWKDRDYFINSQQQMIERYVSQQGLMLSEMDTQHVDAVIDFLYRRYPKEIASEISSFDLWRFIEYGHGILLWDEAGYVQGCIFEIGYRKKPDTSFTIRLAVAKELEGKNLGYHLMLYSCLQAMSEGSKVKRGLIQLGNHKSLYINLNKVGWICESFVPDVCGLGPFFEISLPLDPAGLFTNAVDYDLLRAYVASKRVDIDYRIIDACDLKTIARMYENSQFKIVAMLKEGTLTKRASFLALPGDAIGLTQPG